MGTGRGTREQRLTLTTGSQEGVPDFYLDGARPVGSAAEVGDSQIFSHHSSPAGAGTSKDNASGNSQETPYTRDLEITEDGSQRGIVEGVLALGRGQCLSDHILRSSSTFDLSVL